MQQPAVSGCLLLDLLSHLQDFDSAAEVDASGGQVGQALVIAMVVMVIGEGTDLSFEVAGQVVVFQQNTVRHRLMPPFDLARDLWMMRCATLMIHALTLKTIGQIGGDI